MEPYTHAELCRDRSEIRLLHLEPGISSATGVGTDPIRCSISHVSLDSKPTYAAVSYRWTGGPSAIHVCDGDTQRRLYVCANLEVALRQTRGHTQTTRPNLLIWADAICINQEDEGEKSWQVGMMGRIYEQAAFTLVWLGEDDGTRGEFALQQLRVFGEAHASRLSPTRYFIQSGLDPFCLVEKAGELESDMLDDFTKSAKCDSMGEDMEQAWAAVALLLEREYWSRVWMIQEVALSRMIFILCGREVTVGFYFPMALSVFRQRFDWPGLMMKVQRGETYSKLLWWISNKLMGGTQAVFMTKLLLMGSRRQRDMALSGPQGPRIPLAALLCKACLPSARFYATNRSDLVYALLGLSSDASELNISPDYSLSDSEVYTNVTRSLLTKQDHTWILSLNHHPKSIPDLPSWVPDWSIAFPCVALQRSRINEATVLSTTSTIPSTPSVQDEEFDASRSLSSDKSPPSSSLRLLRLNVVFMDEVAAIGQSYSELGSDSEQFEKGRPDQRTQLWLLELQRLLTSPVGDVAGDRFIRITRVAMTAHNIGQITFRTGVSPGTALEDVASLVSGVLAGSLEQGTEHLYLPLSGVISMYCRNRRAFVTSKGWLGIGPLDTKMGDVAAVVLGAQVPFLLRKAAEGRWQLVGEAYIEGLMQGESFGDSPAVEVVELC